MRIEMLYPEVANLHGDNHNIVYLSQCRRDAEIIRTSLTETPAFVTSSVDLIYLGPSPESGQLKALTHLSPYKCRISELIESGTTFLFTHNAMEILGESLQSPDGTTIPGLGIFPIHTRIEMLNRYFGKVFGNTDLGNGPIQIVGYKTQFSMVDAPDSLPSFLVADRGIGRNRTTTLEGVRRNNFFGTSLVGPLLINNPLFTKALLVLLDPNTEPVLAHEELALAAYQARLSDFTDHHRWHRWEKP